MAVKVLFVSIHRPQRSPSQRFRFEQYIDHLSDAGFEVHYSYLLNKKADTIYYQPKRIVSKAFILFKSTFKRLTEVVANRFDIVFVQKECYMLGISFFERMFAKKSKLIFDFDDAIWLLPQGNTRSGNRALYFLKRPEKTKEIIQAAHCVIAGNDYLADYARQYNRSVRVIPTVLDTQKYHPGKKVSPTTDTICIGWSGSFSTIPHFEYILPALKQIKDIYRRRVYFKVLGDGSYSNSELNIQGVPWSHEKELDELSEMDIGIMPLPNDRWTQGKCGFKGLLYMSMEIPAVLSPVGVNTEIIVHGENGFLADSMEDWIHYLSLLIDNALLRKQLGENGRKTVVEHYSVDANKDTFLSCFFQVLTV